MSSINHEFALSDLDHMLECKVKLFFSAQTHQKFNFIGRILGRKGENLQSIESDCQCRISILGRGSLRNKEDEHQFDGLIGYEHLKEDLHILVTVQATPQQAFYRISKAITILKPYLHPDTAVNVQPHNHTTTIKDARSFNLEMAFPQNIPNMPAFMMESVHDKACKKIFLDLKQLKNISKDKRSNLYNSPNLNKPYSRTSLTERLNPSNDQY